MNEDLQAEIAANWKRAEDSIAAAKMLAEAGFYDFAEGSVFARTPAFSTEYISTS